MFVRFKCLFVVLLAGLLLGGCSSWSENGRRGMSSSLVDYLLPKGQKPPEYDKNVIPHLKLPLNVGLAFVPSKNRYTQGLSEAHKIELLEKVKKNFQGRDFIHDITVIPDTYMRSTRGFSGIDQVSRLYGLDVIALVSYDQVTHVDENNASILYWTIVGAYVIPASENEVQTFVDTAVFDVKTHKMLFRAPGINKMEGVSTLVSVDKETRKNRAKSFSLAMDDMTENLKKELDSFKNRIREDKSVTISKSAGYSGSGALEWPFLLLLLGMMFYRIKTKLH